MIQANGQYKRKEFRRSLPQLYGQPFASSSRADGCIGLRVLGRTRESDILLGRLAVRRRLFAYLDDQMDLIGRDPMGTRIPLSKLDTQAKDLQDKLEMSTAEIGLSVRTTNCLEERGIFTVRDLLNCTRDDLLSISNFGEKTLEEVYKALEGIGFRRQRRQPVAS